MIDLVISLSCPTEVALADGSARHLQHPVEALFRGQAYGFIKRNLRRQIAQSEIEFLHRIERHIRADIARAVAVCAGRADKCLVRFGLFHLVDDVRPYKAAKLMYNAAISPLAAGAGVDNAALLTDPLANRLFFALLLENHAILRHAGVPLARIGPFHPDVVARILRTPLLPQLMSHFFRPSLRGTYCSMAPDMGSGQGLPRPARLRPPVSVTAGPPSPP